MLVDLEANLVHQLLLSVGKHDLAGNTQVVGHFHHTGLQIQRALALEAMTLRIHDHSAVRTSREERKLEIPDGPVLLEEGGEPLATDAALSLEEPYELEEVAAKAGRRKSENNCHAREIARVRYHITTNDSRRKVAPIDEKVSPGTVVHKVHGLAASNRLRSLHAHIAGLQNGCQLWFIPLFHNHLVNQRIRRSPSQHNPFNSAPRGERNEEMQQEGEHIDANIRN